MACKTSFELHHHFPKLADESGFTFNTHRPRIQIDWNKIRLIDIDNLIKERKFTIIEQHLNDILDCVIESEFDVRILDEGVLKLFRLAQLAVEYQQFCRHYLDRSVYVLREEITLLAQELDTCKKGLREKDEEIRRLRKRSKQSFKTHLPYGNDNIATMILKTLSHKGDIFPSTSNDILQYNKCAYCDKVFLNQLYLKSHISRRHSNVIEAPQKDNQDINTNNENTKLSAEINELKTKLKEMESIIASASNEVNTKPITEVQSIVNNSLQEQKKEMRDAEVLTNNEDYLLSKIEEWKKEEHANYNKEMDKLRNQIMESIKTFKEKEYEKPISNEPNVIMQLHETIKQQGAEILALKKELTDSRLKTEKENAERTRESEAQVSFWSNRVELQSQQYELLLQKLNDVAKNAKESRALAESEREHAAQLQTLLQQSVNAKANGNITSTDDNLSPDKKHVSNIRNKSTKKKPNSNKSELEADHKMLEKLHRKAQELLNASSLSSSSSDISSQEIDHHFQKKAVVTVNMHTTNDKLEIGNNKKDKTELIRQNSNEQIPKKLSNDTTPKVRKEKTKFYRIKHSKGNFPSVMPGSPMKLVRAKITEEVNSRLVSAGVDPLKHRLPRKVFQKQRLQIHQQQELKAKKNPAHDKVRHSILAYLDSSTADLKKESPQIQDYVSPTKVTKPFKNLTSVISNVKTKALSFVKMNDTNSKDKRKSINVEVANRAMSLLKTPPGSASASPVAASRSPFKIFNKPQNISRNASTIHVDNEKKEETGKAKNKLLNSHNVTQKVSGTRYEDVSDDSDRKYCHTTDAQEASKSLESLIKSPVRRPASTTNDDNNTVKKYTIKDNNLLRTQSTSSLIDQNRYSEEVNEKPPEKCNENSSDDGESSLDIPVKKIFVSDNIQSSIKQTKSVLKNASSTSSLNKKKVLFDMDAIQMKSLSTSPSQSITEKSNAGNEKYELGLVNLDGEEWDISSIENEPLQNDTKIQNINRTSPKIADLKEKIESQLARRNDTPTVPLVGGIDVLAGSMTRAASLAGSNTSLGSSILDDSESLHFVNHKTFVKPKPKKVSAKDDSDIDISEFSIDGVVKNVDKNESF